MDLSYKPRHSGRRMVGIGVVVALHALAGYALMSGLARKVVDVVKKPLETKIVEEVKLPPPPAPPAPVAVPAPAPAPPAAPPKPALRRGVTPIRQGRPEYPRRALQDEIEGEVIARASVSREGKVVAVTIVSAKPRGVFERSVEAALRQYEFPPDDTEYIVEVPFTFRLE